MPDFNNMPLRLSLLFAGLLVAVSGVEGGAVYGAGIDAGDSRDQVLIAEYRNNYSNSDKGQFVSGSSPRLKVEVSHSDYLPSLPKSLHKGHYFAGWSNTAVPKVKRGKKQGKLEQSYLIPKWLAGKWKRSQSTETKRVKLPEGKRLNTTGTTVAKSEDVFGTYEDSEGKIWQVFNPKQATGVVDRGDVIDHHRVMNYKIEILDFRRVVIEVTASHLVVNKEKKQIVKSFQDEEFNTYTYLGNGKAKTESSVKVFDQLGKPELLTHSVSYVHRIESLED